MEQGDGESGRFGCWSGVVIGACIEVHRELGPGLLESAYETCLCRELDLRGVRFVRQWPLAIAYKDVRVQCGYRLDLVVEDELIVELKAVDRLLPIHDAQLLTYLKLASKRSGLLVNFNERVLKTGIRRLDLRPTFLPSPKLPVHFRSGTLEPIVATRSQ